MRETSQRYSAIIWKQFRRGRLSLACLLFVIVLAVMAMLAPLIANDRPLLMRYQGSWSLPVIHVPESLRAIDFAQFRKQQPADLIMVMPLIPYRPGSYDLDAVLASPSKTHWLGTDGDGRDVAAQLVWGARTSLSVGIIAVGIATIIGMILGLMAGFFGGWIDIVISRLIEVMICFPTFFLILTVLAFVGPSIYNIMVVIGFTGWTGIARLMRAEAFKHRRREYVLAATVSGAGSLRIMGRHILPNTLAPILVSATFGIAGAILAEASLSFLGFGVPPSDPSWGGQLSQAQQFMDIAWWLTLVPGCAIFLTITAYNLIGEALRDAIDPNLRA